MRQRIETANVSSRRRNQGLSAMTEWAVKAGWFMAAVLFSVQAHAATYYFHNDNLGTPQVLTDSTQQVVWKGEYDPFGKVTETVNTVEQNLRFPGQYFDQETGLHYNYFRTYDPSTGRYMESDPIGLAGGLNTYGYANQNSLRYTDEYGLFGMDNIYGFLYKASGGYSPSQNTVDFGAGFGDVITFGLTGVARDFLDINNVDKCSGAYTAGEVAGVAASIATGFVGGTKAFAKQASPVGWTNFSHSLTPNRWRRGSAWSRRGNRLNGDFLPTLGRRPDLHDLMDGVAAGIGGTFKTWPSWRRAINRIPYTPGAGAYAAGSMALNNSGCSC